MSPAPEIDNDAAVELVTKLMTVPGRSGAEGVVADVIAEIAAGLGGKVRVDDAHRRNGNDGDTGNLVVRLPGCGAGRRWPRLMLAAHMDTVPLCLGARPLQEGDRIVAEDPQGGLGADDRAGCAAILTAVHELARQHLPQPPLTLVFTVQEEIGLAGARCLDAALLGHPVAGINIDGGSAAAVCVGAVGGVHWRARIRGIAAHAGVHPAEGVSAATIFAVALARLAAGGWHGAVRKGRRRGTGNVGSVQGGRANNVVMDDLLVEGECRSHSPTFLQRIVNAYERAFQAAARELSNDAGEHGRVTFTATPKYPSFRLSRGAPVVRRVRDALHILGLEPEIFVTDGGLDANFFNQQLGIPTVTIGAGGHHVHTAAEYLSIPEYLDACRLLVLTASAGPDSPSPGRRSGS